jgi:drug/metabolite transporter (DMT)-like permease
MPPPAHRAPRITSAYVALAVLALIWGFSWIAMKIATHDASPLAVAIGRSAVGAVALIALLPVMGRPLRPPPFWPTVVLGLLQTTLYTVVASLAIVLGRAGNTSVLVYTMPFWLALLAWLVLGEPIGRSRSVALVLAGVGLALVVGPFRGGTASSRILAALAGLVWALSAIWAIVLQRTRRFELLSMTAWQMVWGTLAMLPLALVMPCEVRWTASFALSIAYLGAGASAAGWVLWLFVLSRLPASAVGVASMGTPMVGFVSGSLLLHEVPTLLELIGIACILGALVVNARAGTTPSTDLKESGGQTSPPEAKHA